MISKVETSHLNRGDKCFHGIELMKTTTFAFSDIAATFSNFSYICRTSNLQDQFICYNDENVFTYKSIEATNNAYFFLFKTIAIDLKLTIVSGNNVLIQMLIITSNLNNRKS